MLGNDENAWGKAKTNWKFCNLTSWNCHKKINTEFEYINPKF